jgi:hypothetical protein
MKRLLALLLSGLGLRAYLRRRRSTPALEPSPAEDLRAKLAESRATVEAEREDADSGETPVDVDARRADVHARARQAIDDLRDEP